MGWLSVSYTKHSQGRTRPNVGHSRLVVVRPQISLFQAITFYRLLFPSAMSQAIEPKQLSESIWESNLTQLRSDVTCLQIYAPSRRVRNRIPVMGRRRTLLKGGLDVSGGWCSGVKTVGKGLIPETFWWAPPLAFFIHVTRSTGAQVTTTASGGHRLLSEGVYQLKQKLHKNVVNSI